jgi:hypothetical protein
MWASSRSRPALLRLDTVVLPRAPVPPPLVLRPLAVRPVLLCPLARPPLRLDWAQFRSLCLQQCKGR